MLRFVFAFLAAPLFPSIIFAQTAPAAVSPAAQAGTAALPSDSTRPFPLVPILETILAGEISWRPDWPVEVPPDLFTISGEARSITVTLEFPAGVVTEQTDPSGADYSDTVNPADLPEPADKFEYALIRDGDGRLTDFPFFMDRGFSQTRVSYDNRGRIAGLTVSAPVLWRIEFMEYHAETGLPILARLNAGSAAPSADASDAAGSGGAWFFAALEYGDISISETWYNPAGTGLSVYQYRYDFPDGKKRFAESVDFPAGERKSAEYHYDSWGNLTGIGGVYSAVYRENRPQYWQRPLPLPPAVDDAAVSENTARGNAAAENVVLRDAAGEGAPLGDIPWRLTFQWDEQHLVTRLQGYSEDENAGGKWDTRYTYTLDNGGNWKERREIRMIRQGDHLFPQAGLFVSRKIDYRE
jgi:hypothetical protein